MPRAACDAWSVVRSHCGPLFRVDGSAPACAPPVHPVGAAGACPEPETPPPCNRSRTTATNAGRARARARARAAGSFAARHGRRRSWGPERRARVRTLRADVEGGAVRRSRCGDGAARAVEEELAKPWSSGDSLTRSPGSRRVRVTRTPGGTPWGPPQLGCAGASRRSADFACGSRAKREGMGPALHAFALLYALSARASASGDLTQARASAPRPQASAEARRRSCKRSSSFMWILHTRDSLKPSSSPISRSDRSSQYLR